MSIRKNGLEVRRVRMARAVRVVTHDDSAISESELWTMADTHCEPGVLVVCAPHGRHGDEYR
jgi:hypothetical protein